MTKEVKIDKSLKEKAIDIKGKQYVLVADRILFFNETYPEGFIKTTYKEEAERVTFKAVVVPDASKPDRVFTGHSQATWGDGYINKTSALENAETSAVGRALAFMGIGVIESIASVDEISKAKNTEKAMDDAPDCPKCNRKMTISKAGKAYCSYSYKDDCPPKETFTPEYSEVDKKIFAELNEIPVIQMEK